MHSHEIERRLRLPAPDEPAVLPALVLPVFDVGLGQARGRVRLGRQTRSFLGAPPLAFALLALLVAMIGAIAIGALRLDRLPNPFDPNAGFGGRGITLDYPKGWVVAAALNPFNDRGSFTALIVSNVGVTGCSESDLGSADDPTPVISGAAVEYVGDAAPLEDRIFECIIEKPMAAGEIRLVLSLGYPQQAGVGPYEPIDATAWFGPDADTDGGSFYIPTEGDGWTQLIDGMPAKLVVETTSIVPGAEEVRTWGVYSPEASTGLWYVRATLRGPDLEALRVEADTVARSLRFDAELPPPLDEARRDEALARGIDAIDREFREFRNSDIFGCFPRAPGAQDALLTSGPDGPLVTPVPVTCRSEIEATALRLWQVTLTVAWEAGEGYDAGRKAWVHLFDRDGAGGGGGERNQEADVVFPGSVGELPPPLDGPLTIPMGAIVTVLPPGTQGPIGRLFADPNETINFQVVTGGGRRHHVVGGPVTHVGTAWYLVDTENSTSGLRVLQWAPSTDDGRPLLQVVEPACPTGAVDVVAILDLIPAERLACFGNGELVLEPTMLGRLDLDVGGPIVGTPEWLAEDPNLKLYGGDGPDGVEGALPVAIAPTVDEQPPQGVWLSVRGHFDDAASVGCVRTYPEEWDVSNESTEIQVLRCREAFVITSFEMTEAP